MTTKKGQRFRRIGAKRSALRLKPALDALGFGLYYVKTPDRSAFFAALDEIYQSCANHSEPRVYPIIHLDTHGYGDQSGIGLLPSGEKVTWHEFATWCRKINVVTNNNILVASAMCNGLHSISAVSILEPAPFLGLVGPEKPVEAGAIDKGFDAFYESVLKDGDLDQAMKLLGDEFKLFHADRLFLVGFARYLKEACKGPGQQLRIERLLQDWRETQPGMDLDEDKARALLFEHTSPNEDTFERFKKRFLMSDHPENAGRFDHISYDLVYKAAGRAL